MNGRTLLLAITTTIGTTAGSAVAIFEIEDPSWAAPVLLTLLCMVALITLTLEVREYFLNRPRRFHSEKKINRFMYDWIVNEGRVVIFTRDMSWVGGPVHVPFGRRLLGRRPPNIRTLLTRKAEANELVVCLPERIQLADELEQEGASIHTYEELGYTPTSRFTIVRHGRLDGAVAIGRRLAGVQQVEIFGVGEHPAFALADDLVEIIGRLERPGD